MQARSSGSCSYHRQRAKGTRSDTSHSLSTAERVQTCLLITCNTLKKGRITHPDELRSASTGMSLLLPLQKCRWECLHLHFTKIPGRRHMSRDERADRLPYASLQRFVISSNAGASPDPARAGLVVNHPSTELMDVRTFTSTCLRTKF